MPYLPQLSTGATCQFPIRKRRINRTITNTSLDGSTIKIADNGASTIEWQIAFAELTDIELNSLQQFFQELEGRLHSFTFLDPTDNLLAWSEDLNKPVWEKSTLLQLEGNIKDPIGFSRALRLSNNTGSTLRVQQTVNAPAWFHYCFSLYARSGQTGYVALTRGTDISLRELQTTWRRLLFSGETKSKEESLSFGLDIETGTSIEVFGLQLEAQPGASKYKPTHSSSGIYPSARLAEDTLTVTSSGTNRHSCTFKVIASIHS